MKDDFARRNVKGWLREGQAGRGSGEANATKCIKMQHFWGFGKCLLTYLIASKQIAITG
jgi:hypothetical protein